MCAARTARRAAGSVDAPAGTHAAARPSMMQHRNQPYYLLLLAIICFAYRSVRSSEVCSSICSRCVVRAAPRACARGDRPWWSVAAGAASVTLLRRRGADGECAAARGHRGRLGRPSQRGGAGRPLTQARCSRRASACPMWLHNSDMVVYFSEGARGRVGELPR